MPFVHIQSSNIYIGSILPTCANLPAGGSKRWHEGAGGEMEIGILEPQDTLLNQSMNFHAWETERKALSALAKVLGSGQWQGRSQSPGLHVSVAPCAFTPNEWRAALVGK